eukprot:Opistho-2@33881
MKIFTSSLICLLLLVCFSAFAQSQGNLQGTLTTANGTLLPAVNLELKELGRKTLTNEEGEFTFRNIKSGSYTLIISHVGLKKQEKTIVITAGKTTAVNYILQETTNGLNEVLIADSRSANKKPITLGKANIAPLDLPQSVAIISAETIAQQQAVRLSDVVKNVNGVYLGTTRGSTQETFYARGYSFSSNNMFKNGSRINSGSMPEMSSLEKVEVLKGSAAILYGNVAPGGILNMVTKKPKFTQGGEVGMRLGSYDNYKPSADLYGPINNSIAYRVNGTYENNNSFRKNVGSERYYVNPSLLFNTGKNTTLVVQGDYLYNHFTPDFGIGTYNNQIAPLARNTFLGATWQYATTQQTTGSAELNHNINSNWKLNAVGAYQFYKRDYYSTERVNNVAANGDWTRPLNKTLNTEDYYALQVNLNGKFTTAGVTHSLLTGVDADRTFTGTTTYDNPTTYDKINLLDLNKYTQRTDIPLANAIKEVYAPVNKVGIYAQDLITLTTKFKVLAGIRWSFQRAQPTITNDLKTTNITRANGKNDNAFSPRFGLVYQPIQTMAVFASYANSFSTNTGTDVNLAALPPSLIDQMEVGVKNDFLKGLLSVNLTGYRIINNNLAQMAFYRADGVTINSDGNIKELTGQTTSDGFELDVTGRPINGLDIIAGYSYNYMRYTKTSDAATSFTEGQRLVNNPAHTANASVFYTFNTAKVRGLKVGASANYVGKRIGGWNNTNAQTAAGTNRMIPLSAFTTFDLSLGYSFNRFSLLGKLANVGNTLNYYVHENYSANPIPPRQFATTLSYRF